MGTRERIYDGLCWQYAGVICKLVPLALINCQDDGKAGCAVWGKKINAEKGYFSGYARPALKSASMRRMSKIATVPNSCCGCRKSTMGEEDLGRCQLSRASWSSGCRKLREGRATAHWTEIVAKSRWRDSSCCRSGGLQRTGAWIGRPDGWAKIARRCV